MTWRIFLLGCVALAACSEQAPGPDAAKSTQADTAYNSDIDTLEVMVHAMDPSARAFWAGWGEVYDNTGSHNVSAKTEAEWKKVEDGAAMVVLTSNTLLLPAYQRKPEAEWTKWATDVASIAMEGKQAAEAQNISAMELIGGRLDTACDGCHEAFRKPE